MITGTLAYEVSVVVDNEQTLNNLGNSILTNIRSLSGVQSVEEIDNDIDDSDDLDDSDDE